MADIKTPEERSRNMSRIRSRDTKPESWLRKKLFARGYRYRKNAGSIAGHPDAWLARYNTAVFVHGCFWHQHDGCRFAYMPKSRVGFWTDKFRRNRERDRKVAGELISAGIMVIVVWECTVKKMMKDRKYEDEMLDRIERFLHEGSGFLEL